MPRWLRGVIDQLLDAKVPGTAQSVREFYDPDELEGFRQKALNTQVKMDAQADLDWQVRVQEFQDNPNGLTGLFQMHQEELNRSGGVASKRTLQLQQEIASKKHSLAAQAAKLQTENAKATLQSARVAVLTEEAGRFLAGSRDAQRYDTMPKDPELGKYSKDDALLMERGLLERYQGQPAKLLKLAEYMPSGYIANTIQDYWKDSHIDFGTPSAPTESALDRISSANPEELGTDSERSSWEAFMGGLERSTFASDHRAHNVTGWKARPDWSPTPEDVEKVTAAGIGEAGATFVFDHAHSGDDLDGLIDIAKENRASSSADSRAGLLTSLSGGVGEMLGDPVRRYCWMSLRST